MGRRSPTVSRIQEDSEFNMGSLFAPNAINELAPTHPLSLSQDMSKDESAENSEEAAVTTRELHLDGLGNRIRQAVLVIDSELSSAVDAEVRKRLVSTAYSLRNLEEAIIRDGR